MQLAFRTCAVLVVSYSLCGASRLALRGGPNNNTEDAALSAVMSVIKAVSVADHVQSKHTPPTTKTSGTAQQSHAKLDVGFASFEQNLTALIDADLRNATSTAPWNASMREALVANVTKTLSVDLHERFLPLKKDIGKTWMALPEDAQKDEFIGQLKGAFVGVFAGSLNTIQRHVMSGLRRFEALALHQKLSPSELVLRSESGVSESFLREHCYKDAPRTNVAAKKAGAALVQMGEEAKSAMLIQEAIGEAFCIQSLVAGMVNHLNDTMGLISMSMRFEAGFEKV